MDTRTTNNKNKEIRTFGRLKSRRLRPEQLDYIENHLPKYLINDEIIGFLDKDKELNIEIGFGDGRHLAGLAKNNSKQNFIGSEPFINGVVSLIKFISKQNLDNIWVFNDDARLLLQKLPNQSLNSVYILFPDPWPKLRHYKRRIISASFIKELGRVLKQNGEVIIATDHYEYASWILAHFLKATKIFTWPVTSKSDWQREPTNWIKTKYQLIAESCNPPRNITYFKFIKN